MSPSQVALFATIGLVSFGPATPKFPTGFARRSSTGAWHNATSGLLLGDAQANGLVLVEDHTVIVYGYIGYVRQAPAGHVLVYDAPRRAWSHPLGAVLGGNGVDHALAVPSVDTTMVLFGSLTLPTHPGQHLNNVAWCTLGTRLCTNMGQGLPSYHHILDAVASADNVFAAYATRSGQQRVDYWDAGEGQWGNLLLTTAPNLSLERYGDNTYVVGPFDITLQDGACTATVMNIAYWESGNECWSGVAAVNNDLFTIFIDIKASAGALYAMGSEVGIAVLNETAQPMRWDNVTANLKQICASSSYDEWVFREASHSGVFIGCGTRVAWYDRVSNAWIPQGDQFCSGAPSRWAAFGETLDNTLWSLCPGIGQGASTITLSTLPVNSNGVNVSVATQLAGVGSVPNVWQLCEVQGYLLAVGDFTAANGVPANGVALWNGHAWRNVSLPDQSPVFGTADFLCIADHHHHALRAVYRTQNNTVRTATLSPPEHEWMIAMDVLQGPVPSLGPALPVLARNNSQLWVFFLSGGGGGDGSSGSANRGVNGGDNGYGVGNAIDDNDANDSHYSAHNGHINGYNGHNNAHDNAHNAHDGNSLYGLPPHSSHALIGISETHSTALPGFAIAVFDFVSGSWSIWDQLRFPADAFVFSMTMSQDNTLLIGGRFQAVVGNRTFVNVARYSQRLGHWMDTQPITGGTQGGGYVSGVAMTSWHTTIGSQSYAQTAYAGGRFSQAGAQQANNIVGGVSSGQWDDVVDGGLNQVVVKSMAWDRDAGKLFLLTEPSDTIACFPLSWCVGLMSYGGRGEKPEPLERVVQAMTYVPAPEDPFWMIVIISTVVVVVLFILTLGIVVYYRRNRAERQYIAIPDYSVQPINDAMEYMTLDDSVTKIPRFKLDVGEIIGYGGQGVVRQGVYEDREVAIKMVRQDAPEDVAAFLQEAKVMSVLSHPNIVQFVGVCITADAVLLVTELMDLDLRKALPRLTMAQRCNVARDVARAMLCLHSYEPPVLHRDLKMSNVLLRLDGTCKITDFGVSRTMLDQQTMTRDAGTFIYQAPEVWTHGRYNETADVWSFGMLLVEMFDGTAFPHIGQGGLLDFLSRVQRGEVRPVLPQDPRIPKPLLSVMRSCLQLDADERPTFDDVYTVLFDVEV